MKNALLAGVAASVLLLSGCASLPTPSVMQEDIKGYQLPMRPTEGEAIVYVVRPSSLGGLIRFNVFVDNKQDTSEMGYTRSRQYIYFNVKAGDHQILSKAENWAAINITAKPNDIIFLQQEPSMGLIMARNNIFPIQPYEGKYQVKHLSLGTIKRLDHKSEPPLRH